MKNTKYIPYDKIAVTFIGQAGFIFTREDGFSVGIDLYLSDCCYRFFGFKRLMPYIVQPSDLDLDVLISTHAHYDHFDPDSVPIIMSNKKTKLVCAYDVRAEIERLHLEEDRVIYVKAGDTFETDGIRIKAVPCDHGDASPDAVGILLEIGTKRIYITGDTAYRSDYFENEELHGTDLLILPINGAFGNINETEAAKASALLSPKLTVPCHFWNFAEHGGNPALFAEKMKLNADKSAYLLMRHGETVWI